MSFDDDLKDCLLDNSLIENVREEFIKYCERYEISGGKASIRFSSALVES